MPWSKIIEEAGVRVRLYERPGRGLYRSIVINGRKDRKALGHSDRKLAENQAKALAKELALARLTGITPDTITLGQLFSAYRRGKFSSLSDRWKAASERRMAMFSDAWGKDLVVTDIGQSQVDSYVRKRRSGDVQPPRQQRKWRKPRDGTIDSDMRHLRSIFNWARKERVNGRRMLRENPLDGLHWPKESDDNIRRPVASHQRYLATQEHADAVDPKGRLRCMLALARYTGRREGAICALRASDLLLSQEAVHAALAAAGMDEGLAEHMPHGAIRWRAESDKQGVLRIVPISTAAREALEAYQRQAARVGEAPLFPSPADDGTPVNRHIAYKWLRKAEKRAEVPKLAGSAWHAYRRLWAAERKHMPDVDVAAAGGWSDVQTMKRSYQRSDAETRLRVVEGGGDSA